MQDRIYVNKTGYSAEGRKLATFIGGDHECFEVLNADSGDIVFSGLLTTAVRDQLSSNAVRIIDFTRAPKGRCVLRVGATVSQPFDIKPSPEPHRRPQYLLPLEA